jgi:hypothetical protein
MTAVADETQDLAASPTRRDVVWTVAAALAGLGVVVNAAAPRAAVSPVIATAMNSSGAGRGRSWSPWPRRSPAWCCCGGGHGCCWSVRC